jgi:hypothetical protein
MSKNYRKLLNEIKKGETEMFLWQILAEHVTSKLLSHSIQFNLKLIILKMMKIHLVILNV